MRESTLIAFLTDLGLWPAKRSGDNHFGIRCLYPHKHVKGMDIKPSAGVSFDDGISWFSCFACGTKRPMVAAVYENGTQGWSLISIKYKAIEEIELKDIVINKPLVNEITLTPTNCNAGLKRLRKHGLTNELKDFLISKHVDPEFAWKKFFVAYVPEGHTDEFMGVDEFNEPKRAKNSSIFTPTLIQDNRGIVCIGGQARPIYGTKSYFTLYSYSARNYLYGEHLLETVKGKPLFVEEGQFDVIKTWQCNQAAVGLFGLFVSEPRAFKIARARPSHVRLFLDPDKYGKDATEAATSKLHDRGILTTVVDHGTDPKYCDELTFKKLVEPIHVGSI